MPHESGNALYYGDNLDVLRRHVADASVDLIYLDPPFNSNADYNVLFAEKDGARAASQIKAFEDTWTWDEQAARAFHEAVESGVGRVPQAMRAFESFLGSSDMLAYLSMMAPRLIELRRVLKPTGSIYLHCDPTASRHGHSHANGSINPVATQRRFARETSHAPPARLHADIDRLHPQRRARPKPRTLARNGLPKW